MGSESQQDEFNRLTLVSNSMAPVSGNFQDGCGRSVFRVCVHVFVCLQRCDTSIRHTAEMLPAHQIIVSLQYVSHYYSYVVKKYVYDPIVIFTHPCRNEAQPEMGLRAESPEGLQQEINQMSPGR